MVTPYLLEKISCVKGNGEIPQQEASCFGCTFIFGNKARLFCYKFNTTQINFTGFEATYLQQQALTIESLHKENAQLQKENAELRKRMKVTSFK